MSRRGQGGGPTAYDFRRPIKLSREHVRTLQIAFETYARSCGTLLTTRLRVVSSVTLASIEQLNYDEYVASLNNPTVIAVVSLDPLHGTALMEMSSSAVMTAIDHMLGGPGGPQPERPLTEVEMPLLRGLLERMLGELRYGFETLVDIAAEAQGDRVQRPVPARARAGRRLRGRLLRPEDRRRGVPGQHLPAVQHDPAGAVPHRGDRAQRQASGPARTWRCATSPAGLSAAPIDVAVRFQPIRMRTDDIVDLRPGDVVPLGHPTSRPLEVTVNETVFAHAVPGNQGARLACLVVPPPKESSKESGRP